MLIEGLDSLKSWLSERLEPICDAEPVALARYVIALIKKDKATLELKALCEDQLDVFLGEVTKTFVSDLFDCLESKYYLPPVTKAPVEEPVKVAATIGKKRKSIEEDDEQTEVEKFQKTDKKNDVTDAKTLVEPKEQNNVTNENTVSNEQANDKPSKSLKENRSSNANMNNADRAMSIDRSSMKSLSPVRPKHSSYRRRSSRSPPSRSSRHSKGSRRERSRRDHRDKSRERRSRRKEKEKCRDYEEKGFCMLGEVCPYDHGNDPLEVDDSNLPQMLTLAGLPTTQPSQPPPTVFPAQPAGLQFIPNVPRPPTIANGLTLNTGLTTVHVQKQTPIPSPIEVNRNQVPIFRPRNPAAFIRNISPPITPATSTAVSAELSVVSQPPPTTTTTTSAGEAYNPEAPAIEATETEVKTVDAKKSEKPESDNRTADQLVQIAMGNIPLTPIVGSHHSNIFQLNNVAPHQQQMQMFQNIPVPEILPAFPNPQMQMQLQLQQQQQFQLQQQQQQGMLNQQNHSRGGRQSTPKTMLELRKVPAELNNIVKLSQHFQKFGTITKLQAPFENDNQAALIEFSNYQEAAAAYTCPEAILGNRFIKMFWHYPNRRGQQQQPSKQTNGHEASEEAKTGEPPAAVAPKVKKVIASSDQLVYRNPKTNPVLIQKEKKKEFEELKQKLVQAKQTNYEDLVKKQKSIAMKLQEKNISSEDKDRLLKLFKHCDATAKKIKKEIMEENKARAPSPVKALLNDPKKEILDREIDIYHGNLEGAELEEAKRSLDLFKKQSGFYGRGGRGGYRARGRGRGWQRGAPRGRGRGGFKTSLDNRVDNRPKQLLVSGFGLEEKEAVIAHFATFTQIDRIEETTPDKLILTFPTRQSAEVAASNIEFNGKQLALSWFKGTSKPAPPAETEEPTVAPVVVNRSMSTSLSEKDLDDELLELDKDEEEMLLAGADDDEDEDMERSWKR